MKYWIDTEFIERPCTIDLISVGLVAEDGREFYAESNEIDHRQIQERATRARPPGGVSSRQAG